MKISPSQITKYLDSPWEWIWSITKIKKRERDTFFTSGTVVHKVIEIYNKEWRRETDYERLIQEALKKDNVTDATEEELTKIREEIYFAVENYMSTNPEQHEWSESYMNVTINWHILNGYNDAIGYDYKTVSKFCDPNEKVRNWITKYYEYRVWALMYSLMCRELNIPLSKYVYKEILKSDWNIPENTTITKEKLVEITGIEFDWETKAQYIQKHRPRKQTVNDVVFIVDDEFIREARELFDDVTKRMQADLEAVKNYIESQTPKLS